MVTLTLRLDDKLHDQVRVLAAIEHRSVNSVISEVIRSAVSTTSRKRDN
jgi:predicted HicB family RNase H-like nuclease